MHQTEHHAVPHDRQGRRRRLTVVLALVTGAVLTPVVSVAGTAQASTSTILRPTSSEHVDARQSSTTVLSPATRSTRRPFPKPTKTPTPTPSGPVAPHAPVGMWVASSPEVAPQFCQSTTAPLVRTTSPVLGVNSGAPAYNTDRPNLQAAFEVSRASGEPLLAQNVAFVGSLARFQMPDGILTDGAYRLRARAVDGTAVSEWLPWCAFTVDSSDSVGVPGVPDTLRISTGPYSGFQQCGGAGGDPVMGTGDSVTLAASPTPYIVGVTYPNLSATFEIGHPGEEPLIRRTDAVWPSGLVFGLGVAPGTLAPGSYQFRVRAEDGNVASAWSPWCGFTVTA
ncbi:hypothetical protein [Nonomuraea sp. NPDC049784]|uniref:hypothetical protein n=1 Tax=Nonomuraea sp. NPDC049784 TaxID=3154361 RepID=UPI0033EA65ED